MVNVNRCNLHKQKLFGILSRKNVKGAEEQQVLEQLN